MKYIIIKKVFFNNKRMNLTAGIYFKETRILTSFTHEKAMF